MRNQDSPPNPLNCPHGAFLAPPASQRNKVPLSLTEHTPPKCLPATCPRRHSVQAFQTRARSHSPLCPQQVSETQVFTEGMLDHCPESPAERLRPAFRESTGGRH